MELEIVFLSSNISEDVLGPGTQKQDQTDRKPSLITVKWGRHKTATRMAKESPVTVNVLKCTGLRFWPVW